MPKVKTLKKGEKAKPKENLLFSFLDSINYTKKDIMTPENEKKFPAFMVNRFLSQHNDTLTVAAMNSKMYQLDNRMQYDFLMGTIRKRKRYARKFVKAIYPDGLDLVKQYFQVGTQKGLEIMTILDHEELEYIKAFYDEGGKQ